MSRSHQIYHFMILRHPGTFMVTYIPDIEDLYGDNEDDQVYIARILKDNIRRLPE